MDIDWKENLEQILLLHEVGIECEIKKTVAAFEALSIPPLNSMQLASLRF